MTSKSLDLFESGYEMELTALRDLGFYVTIRAPLITINNGVPVVSGEWTCSASKEGLDITTHAKRAADAVKNALALYNDR